MNSYRMRRWPNFIKRPTEQQIARLVARVRAILGAEKLADLHPVHIRSIEQSLYQRLQEMGGDHSLIKDPEIEGWIEMSEIAFPQAFLFVSAALGQQTAGTGFSLADDLMLRADREGIPACLAIDPSFMISEVGHA